MCLGSDKPHPWASPELAQSLPFSHGSCIKTSLNLAKAKYFPDVLPSGQLNLFASCWARIQWPERWPWGDRAQGHCKRWQCSPGQAVSAANGSPSKGWITASVCSEHKKLMYSEEEIKKAFPPKEGISYLPHPEVHNSLSAIEFQQHRAAGEQQLTAQSLTRSLCFQPLSRCLPLALPLLVLKPVTAECSN